MVEGIETMTSKNAQELTNAFGYLFGDEVDGLHQLANMLPENPLVINIGAGSGTSGMAFLESRNDLWLTTVDKRLEDSPLGSLGSELIALSATGLDFLDRYMAINGDSKDVGKLWNGDDKDSKIDLVFIDGDHRYDGCKGDMDAWLPHIKSGGILAFHDYDKIACYYKACKNREPTQAERERVLVVPKLRRAIKPWPAVTYVVNEFMVGNYEQVLYVNSLIAFRKP